MNNKKLIKKITSMKKGVYQRLYYIKNMRYGFSPIFLLPGSLREKLGEHTFFRVLTKKIEGIKLSKKGDSMVLHAKDLTLRFPHRCFYEGDFFDIIYPRLTIASPLIEKLVYENPYYESEGCYESFGATLHNGDYVLDAGANVGMFSIVASKAVGNDGKIFAFEPLKEISTVLEENARNNQCTNITVENKLLGEKNTVVDFYYNLESNYNAASKALHHDGDNVIRLEQITLDDYVEKNNIQKIDFIKADIEGAERDFIKGAEKTIKRFKPKMALRTYHLPDDPEVLFNLVKGYVPEYQTKHHKKTLYVWM